MSSAARPLTRRRFLATGTAWSGAVWAAPYVARSAPTPDTLNVAVIGCGDQGRVLLQAALGIPGVRVRAVCDIWEYHRIYGQRLLQRFGHEPRVFEDYREMLAAGLDLDAVFVATPDFVHAEQSIACLRAGLHVYCEKMMAHTVEAARAMGQAARATGKLLQIGHQRRSHPQYRHAQERLLGEARLLGRLTHATGQWNRAVAEDRGYPARYPIPEATLQAHGYANMREFRNWRWYRRYANGPISDLGAHQIDIFNWFLGGPPQSVMAGGGCDYYAGREWYDNVMAIFEYPTPAGLVRASYQVFTTTSAGGGYHEYFMGDEGALKISENPQYTRLFAEARAPSWDEWEERKYIVRQREAETQKGADGAAVDVRETAELAAWKLPGLLDGPIHRPHVENFFRAIRSGTPLHCPPETAFATAVTVLRVNEAVAAQRRLAFAPADFVL